ncbi:sensor histidine kinase [Saccharothrix coeruleofusca]|uniref:histidine kinase n=1 Tax=Saccharothrix coeruleofusca TaxID=33919 RepID=A0A918AQE1_9PSEU|nr:histidine kinase [Saccharothrix coeruleofusca]GGP72968.1 histidine kinase [Saccharothrix coeruleofusca]
MSWDLRPSLWVLAGIPLLLATVERHLAVWETALHLVVIGVALTLVKTRPIPALGLGCAQWLLGFVLGVLASSAEASFAPAAGLPVVAYLAGRHSTGDRGPLVLVAVVSTVFALCLALGGLDTALLATAVVAALAVVPWTVGRYRLRHAELLRLGWEQAERLERDVERGRARERTRLAAELHDLIGHELARAALGVGALEVDPALSEQHRATASAARQAVTAAAERLADAVRLLRTEPDETGSVERLVARARESGVAVELVGRSGALDPVIARTVHRVVAEGITNAVKHAPGSAVVVQLSGTTVRVRNGEAQTRASPPGSGYGLIGLAERVALVGGTFTAEPLPDGGFEVTAVLPPQPITSAAPTRVRRELAEEQVRTGVRRMFLATLGVSAAAGLAAIGYIVFDAATSMLPEAEFERLRIGQPEAEIPLPWRARVDNPDDVTPVDAVCRYYSTRANPFDERGRDLYRLCFRDGVLVDKTLLRRGG